VAGHLTQEQKQLAFRLRARGWSLVDIARDIGCTAPMVGLMVRDGKFLTGVPDGWEPRAGCLTIGQREDPGRASGRGVVHVHRRPARTLSVHHHP
jgi:transposase, IS30 family